MARRRPKVTLVAAAMLLLLLVGPAASYGLPVAPGHLPPPGAARPPASLPAPSQAVPAAPSVTVSPTGPGWINVSSGTLAPPGAYGASLAYDVADSAWIEFGGCAVAACPTNWTWAYADGGWQNISGSGSTPAARDAASMVYDAGVGGVLLFGGYDASGGALNDTWLFQDGHWTDESFLGPAPLPRGGANLVFDPAPDVNASLLFGGCAGSPGYACFNDTWTWQTGSGWTQVSIPTTPPARGGASMTYDPVGGVIVLFGGEGSCGTPACLRSDTWEFYGGLWWRLGLSPEVSPPGRTGASLAFDTATGVSILFGGYNGTTGASGNDSWAFANGSWAPLLPSISPSIRSFSAISADAGAPAPLLFGGAPVAFARPLGPALPTHPDLGAYFLNDTWVYETPPQASFAATDPGTAELGAPVNYSVAISGGTAPLSVSVNYGDGNGASQSGTGPGFAFAHAATELGTLSLRAVASDRFGVEAGANGTVAISPGPSVNGSAAVAGGDVGIPDAFVGTVHPSLVPITSERWAFGDGSSAPTGNASHAFAGPGTYAVTFSVVDADGASVSALLSFPVAGDPAVSITSDNLTPSAGAGTSFRAVVTGGTAPYRYAWLWGDGSSGSALGPVHAYATSGTYRVQVWVNDSAGGSAHALRDVTVHAATGTGPGSAGGSGSSASSAPPAWYWVAVALIVLGTVGVGALLLRRGPGS